MKKVITFVALACLLLLVLGATPVYANGIPALPHAFYGSVTVNGSPAPSGTRISATVDSGVVITNNQNPVATVGGSYGIDSPYLLVQGNITPGATITFYVNGVSTGQTATFEAGGGPTAKNLSVTITAPPPTIETNLFGIEGSFPISNTGEILETIEATSEDGNLTITIEAGTIALDAEGKPLSTLTAAVEPSPPEPPEGTYLIGAYDFGPDGATFDPPITLTWSYDPKAVPEGMEVVIAYYDEETKEWVWVPCEVDTENNIITASVAHFTTFAIIAVVPVVPPEEEKVPPVGEEEEEEEEEEVITVTPAAFSVSYLSVSPRLEVEPGEVVTIAVLVANTGGESGSYTVVLKIDGVKEAEETVTVAAGESQDVSFSVTREEAGIYTVAVDGLSGSFTVVPVVPLAKPGINWPLIGGIIGGVVVIGLGVFFLVRRRAY